MEIKKIDAETLEITTDQRRRVKKTELETRLALLEKELDKVKKILLQFK